MNVRVTPLLTLAVVIGLAVSAISRVHAQPSTAVQIETVAIEGSTLTIKGSNFGGGVPAVSVNDINAAVSRNSDTEIVAVAPPLETGIYILKVVRDSSEGGTGVTTLQIR